MISNVIVSAKDIFSLGKKCLFFILQTVVPFQELATDANTRPNSIRISQHDFKWVNILLDASIYNTIIGHFTKQGWNNSLISIKNLDTKF